MRQPKGTVSVSVCRGMLRLQLPRHLYGGEQRYLYLGLPDTPTNRQSAQARAQAIASDIAFDRFDATLERYRPTAIQPDNLPTLGELWQKYTFYKAKDLSPTTLDKDFKRVANHIAAMPTQKLRDARRIRKHLIDTLTSTSAKKVLMHLSACCQWAMDEEMIPNNPFRHLPKVKGGKSTQDINPFTQGERDQIIQAFEQSVYYSHYAAFVKFLFFTGCRTSEAVGLQWKHISADLKTITFSEAVVNGVRKGTKTGKIRKFPVNDFLRSLLIEIRPPNPKPDEIVFKSPEGLLIDAHNFLNRAWTSVLEPLSITYRPQYNTRHTFITLCLEYGIPDTQVAQWVGNSARTIWQHYAGIINRKQVPDL